MPLFRLDASIRVEGSHSREIADIVEQEWRTAHPHSEERSPEQVEAVNLAAPLIRMTGR
jgi:hypothetical protein